MTDAGAWSCEHRDTSGSPAPSTWLTVSDARTENSNAPAERKRALLTCPDCGTDWRVWQKQRLAKWYLATGDRSNPCFQLTRFCQTNVDEILAVVRQTLPDLRFAHHHQYWPHDDDGLWFFDVPGARNSVQIESSSGMCPFLVEHDLSNECYHGASVEEVSSKVVEWLRL